MRSRAPHKNSLNISALDSELFIRRRLKNFQILLGCDLRIINDKKYSDFRTKTVNLKTQQKIFYFFSDILGLDAAKIDFHTVIQEPEKSYAIFLKDAEKNHSKILQALMFCAQNGETSLKQVNCTHWPTTQLNKKSPKFSALQEAIKKFLHCETQSKHRECLVDFTAQLCVNAANLNFSCTDFSIKTDALTFSIYAKLKTTDKQKNKWLQLVERLMACKVYALFVQPGDQGSTLEVLVVQPHDCLAAHAIRSAEPDSQGTSEYLTLFVLSNLLLHAHANEDAHKVIATTEEAS